MGGKCKIAKEILPIILADRKPGQYFVDVFCGGAGILDKVENPRIGNDINDYVVNLLNEVAHGWEPPQLLSEEEYYAIKANPGDYSKSMVAFAAIPCSYAAKWWGGYARGSTNKGVPRNYANEARKHLIKQGKLLQGVEFHSGDYKELVIPNDSIVYCDIPYFGTTQYYNRGFNYHEFWEWANYMSTYNKVFVSEYVAPDNWKAVWSKEVNSSLTKDTGSKKAVEKLFIRS